MTTMAGTIASWPRALMISLGSAWLWILPTAFAVWSAQRFPVTRGNVWPAAAVHAGGVLGVVSFRALAVAALNPVIGWYVALPSFPDILLTSFFNNTFVWLLLVGVGHALHYARVTRWTERQLEQARLRTLKAQLQPHFLFNTLHAISSFVRDQPLKAEGMIAQLSALLRASLKTDSRQEVTLGEELALLRPYLQIEQARFEDRLQFRIDVPPEVQLARIPSLVLQPLVENAVRHSISRNLGPARIEIQARHCGNQLCVAIRDNGAGLPGSVVRHGIGLDNLRARLQQLYGDGRSFRLDNSPDGGAIATVSIPFNSTTSALRPESRQMEWSSAH